jgi:alpha-L-fucosidase
MWNEGCGKYNMYFGLNGAFGAPSPGGHLNKGADSYGPYKGVPYDGNDPEYENFSSCKS